MTLLGRGIELARVDDLFGAVLSGRGQALVLEGAAGIGKTALLNAARARALDAGLSVFSARADELESEHAYGVVRQWLEREWARAVEHGVVDQAAEFALSRVPRAPPAREDATFGILHALYLFTSELSMAAPLVLALDDGQWADRHSLRFLAYLTRRIEALPIGVLVTVRAGPAGAQTEFLDHVRGEPVSATCQVTALDDGACAALLAHAFGSEVGPAFSDTCRRACGGNPLYLLELQRALAAEGTLPLERNAHRVEDITPSALARHVSARLAAVAADAPLLAGAMSVIGDGGSLRHAALLAGLEARRAGELARGLVHAAILSEEDPIAFAHPIVRRVIAERLTSVERDDAHRGAARLLREEHAEPERAAAHLLIAQPRGLAWCVAALREAAAHAMSRSAPDAAAGYCAARSRSLRRAGCACRCCANSGPRRHARTTDARSITCARRVRPPVTSQNAPGWRSSSRPPIWRCSGRSRPAACSRTHSPNWGANTPRCASRSTHRLRGRRGCRPRRCRSASACWARTGIGGFPVLRAARCSRRSPLRCSSGAPVAIANALRAAGIVDGGERGLALLRDAVAALDGSPAALERARAHIELGAALRRANQRRAAREQLDIGLRLAQRSGAGPLAQRAYDELQASGLRLRRADLDDRDALTPAELRIARAAARGLTNREIAATLYLSIKTIEMHLGRVYRKLGITTRDQLPAAVEPADQGGTLSRAAQRDGTLAR
jgi:DNA-binding CsgD family transcriptional regulator